MKYLTYISLAIIATGITLTVNPVLTNKTIFTLPLIQAGQTKQTARLTEQSKVAINGIGPIRVGMTVSEASRSAGVRLVQRQSGGEDYGCFYFKPQKQPSGVEFMVTQGRISRVDVTNPRITTVSGAKIGDSERRIKSLYPGQIKVTPHNYVLNGHDLTFVPRDSQDNNYRIVFETENGYVTGFRAGKLPEVGWIESCL